MSGTIALTRHSVFQLRPRSYKVWIDGRVVGRLTPNGAAEFTVEPGAHLVELSVDGMFSKRIPLEVYEGLTRRLHCSAHSPLAYTAFGLLLPGLAVKLTLTH